MHIGEGMYQFSSGLVALENAEICCFRPLLIGLSVHRGGYVPIFIWIGCFGDCLDVLLHAVANRVK